MHNRKNTTKKTLSLQEGPLKVNGGNWETENEFFFKLIHEGFNNKYLSEFIETVKKTIQKHKE